MAVYLRATVMLIVLVGLPGAWVYYGPLPEKAQAFADRVIELGKTAWEGEIVETQQELITAPRFASNLEPVRYDEQIKPASRVTAVSDDSEVSLESQVEPHLSVLRSLGASEYALEEWGEEGQLFRFRCKVALGSSDDWTKHFEAVSEDALTAILEVVGEVSSWQNARGGVTQWR